MCYSIRDLIGKKAREGKSDSMPSTQPKVEVSRSGVTAGNSILSSVLGKVRKEKRRHKEKDLEEA